MLRGAGVLSFSRWLEAGLRMEIYKQLPTEFKEIQQLSRVVLDYFSNVSGFVFKFHEYKSQDLVGKIGS